ncbi:unnamed protein product [Peniophora sp. CBMAI 1063]|nr:unnamed protein product [Peniophora sp. CBMAI 1063]
MTTATSNLGANLLPTTNLPALPAITPAKPPVHRSLVSETPHAPHIPTGSRYNPLLPPLSPSTCLAQLRAPLTTPTDARNAIWDLLSPKGFRAWREALEENFFPTAKIITDNDKISTVIASGITNERLCSLVWTNRTVLINLTWEKFIRWCNKNVLTGDWDLSIRESVTHAKLNDGADFQLFLATIEELNELLKDSTQGSYSNKAIRFYVYHTLYPKLCQEVYKQELHTAPYIPKNILHFNLLYADHLQIACELRQMTEDEVAVSAATAKDNFPLCANSPPPQSLGIPLQDRITDLPPRKPTLTSCISVGSLLNCIGNKAWFPIYLWGNAIAYLQECLKNYTNYAVGKAVKLAKAHGNKPYSRLPKAGKNTANLSNTNTSSGTSSSSGTGRGHSAPVSPLKDSECAIICNNRGCTRCRPLFIYTLGDHDRNNCPWPAGGDAYQEITPAYARKIFAQLVKAGNTNLPPLKLEGLRPIGTQSAAIEVVDRQDAANNVNTVYLGIDPDVKEGIYITNSGFYNTHPKSLCAPVILRQSFLATNCLVYNTKDHTFWSKDTGYDILHPNAPLYLEQHFVLPPLPTAQDRECVRATQDQHYHEAYSVHVSAINSTLADARKNIDMLYEPCISTLQDFLPAIDARIATIAYNDHSAELDVHYKTQYASVFASIPHASQLPTDILHSIMLKDTHTTIHHHSYRTPKQYKAMFEALLGKNIVSGCIRPSTSRFVSPSFLVNKPDGSKRLVIDYRQLDKNTVPNSCSMLLVNDILHDCALSKIWGKLDMTAAFHQTRMDPASSQYTAFKACSHVWESSVMPMGGRNTPAVQQRCLTIALGDLVGKICHVYLDDIVIWLQSLAKHQENVAKVLAALANVGLYCLLRKSTLFADSITFLGHRISHRGIEANGSKCKRVLDWPVPKNTKDVCSFLGLVHYIADFLPILAKYTRILTPLTIKAAERTWPGWQDHH